MVRRLLITASMLVLAAGALAGCGSGEDDKLNPVPPPPAQPGGCDSRVWQKLQQA